MKNKKGSLKKLAPMPAAAALLALAASAAQAQTTPVFNYTFPASWGGTGTTVTDQSSAGNNGAVNNTVTLSSAVPPGSSGGTESIVVGSGGIDTTATSLLNNTAIAGAGGFTYNVDFMWNGTAGASSRQYIEKLLDYAGTESLQIAATNSSMAALQMSFANDSSNEVAAVYYDISPNTWYDVTMTFNTTGNSIDSNGGITGIADLYVNGSLVDSASAQKGNYGDKLGRAIGVGEWAANGEFGLNILDFQGDIYNPSVELGVAPVPEPSTLALSLLGGFGAMGMMWKVRRRKG